MAHWDDEALVQRILMSTGREPWQAVATDPLRLAEELLGDGSIELTEEDAPFCSRHYLYVPESADETDHRRNVAQALCLWRLAFREGVSPWVGWNRHHIGAALELPIMSFLPAFERIGTRVGVLAHELHVSMETIVNRLEALGHGASSCTSGFLAAVKVL